MVGENVGVASRHRFRAAGALIVKERRGTTFVEISYQRINFVVRLKLSVNDKSRVCPHQIPGGGNWMLGSRQVLTGEDWRVFDLSNLLGVTR
jgi:hypothetical protein